MTNHVNERTCLNSQNLNYGKSVTMGRPQTTWLDVWSLQDTPPLYSRKSFFVAHSFKKMSPSLKFHPRGLSRPLIHKNLDFYFNIDLALYINEFRNHPNIKNESNNIEFKNEIDYYTHSETSPSTIKVRSRWIQTCKQPASCFMNKK